MTGAEAGAGAVMLVIGWRTGMMLHTGVMGHRRRHDPHTVMGRAPMHPGPVRELHQQQQDGGQRAKGTQDGAMEGTDHGRKNRTISGNGQTTGAFSVHRWRSFASR